LEQSCAVLTRAKLSQAAPLAPQPTDQHKPTPTLLSGQATTQPRRVRKTRPRLCDDLLRELILRLARENPPCGYKRIVGDLKRLGIRVSGIRVSTTSVRTVLLQAGPARRHSERTRHGDPFSERRQLACDFLTVETCAVR